MSDASAMALIASGRLRPSARKRDGNIGSQITTFNRKNRRLKACPKTMTGRSTSVSSSPQEVKGELGPLRLPGALGYRASPHAD